MHFSDFNELLLDLVILAKAGIQGPEGRSGRPWTSAFAGVTITRCKLGHTGGKAAR
jgi:hypothetical protein